MPSAPTSHSKLKWLQECRKMRGARQTGDRKTPGHSLAPSPPNPRDGRKRWFRAPQESLPPARIQHRVSSPAEREPPLSPSGTFPRERRSTREPPTDDRDNPLPPLLLHQGTPLLSPTSMSKSRIWHFWHWVRHKSAQNESKDGQPSQMFSTRNGAGVHIDGLLPTYRPWEE